MPRKPIEQPIKGSQIPKTDNYATTDF